MERLDQPLRCFLARQAVRSNASTWLHSSRNSLLINHASRDVTPDRAISTAASRLAQDCGKTHINYRLLVASSSRFLFKVKRKVPVSSIAVRIWIEIQRILVDTS